MKSSTVDMSSVLDTEGDAAVTFGWFSSSWLKQTVKVAAKFTQE